MYKTILFIFWRFSQTHWLHEMFFKNSKHHSIMVSCGIVGYPLINAPALPAGALFWWIFQHVTSQNAKAERTQTTHLCSPDIMLEGRSCNSISLISVRHCTVHHNRSFHSISHVCDTRYQIHIAHWNLHCIYEFHTLNQFEIAPSESVNFISVVTSCAGLWEEAPQTAHLTSFTWASHIAASVLMGH